MGIESVNNGLFYQIGKSTQPKKENLLWAKVANGKVEKNGTSFVKPKEGDRQTPGRTRTGEESAVSAYLKENPFAYKEVSDAMQTGRAYLSKKWFGGNPTKDMDLGEYKAYMSDLMKKSNVGIRKDSTAMVENINDKAWEQMKNDPDFEAYMVGSAALGKDVTREEESFDYKEALKDFYMDNMLGSPGIPGDNSSSSNAGTLDMIRYAINQGNGRLISAVMGEQSTNSLLNMLR